MGVLQPGCLAPPYTLNLGIDPVGNSRATFPNDFPISLGDCEVRKLSVLELTLLGPAHICLNGKPVADFFSSKALILFCYLALEEDRVCARETLTDFLWGEHPGMLAKSNVRQSLHNLQKRFPG